MKTQRMMTAAMVLGAAFIAPGIAAADYGMKARTQVNVRSGPGTGYSRVGGLHTNNHVAVFGTSGGWYKIFYSGAYRWIIATYTAKL